MKQVLNAYVGRNAISIQLRSTRALEINLTTIICETKLLTWFVVYMPEI